MAPAETRRRSKGFRQSLSSLSDALVRTKAPDTKCALASAGSRTTLVFRPSSRASQSSTSPTKAGINRVESYRIQITKNAWGTCRYCEDQSSRLIPINMQEEAPFHQSFNKPRPAPRPNNQFSINRPSTCASTPHPKQKQGATDRTHRRTLSDTTKPLPPLPLQPRAPLRRSSETTLRKLDTSSSFSTLAAIPEFICELDTSEARKRRPSQRPRTPSSGVFPEISPLTPSFNPEKLYFDICELPGASDIFLPPDHLPPSPPDTPDTPQREFRLDSLSWLSTEIAELISAEKLEEEEEDDSLQSWLNLSSPSTPFSCSFPEFLSMDRSRKKIQPKKSPSLALEKLPSKILLRVFSFLPTAADMESLALAHTALMRAFEPSAVPLLNAAMKHDSPALYDLLVLLGTADSYAAHSAAISTVTATAVTLKSCIRTRCSDFLSTHLLLPVSSDDEKAFDDAIFTVWSFSRRFSRRPEATTNQAAWLRSRRLGMQQLCDVLELYQCLGVLLCPLSENTHAAVRAGVVSEHPAHTQDAVELWVVWLQTLDIGTLMPLLTVDEDDDGARWRAVDECGLARQWDCAAASEQRNALRMFLKEPAGLVYGELSAAERKRTLEERWGIEGIWGETWEM